MNRIVLLALTVTASVAHADGDEDVAPVAEEVDAVAPEEPAPYDSEPAIASEPTEPAITSEPAVTVEATPGSCGTPYLDTTTTDSAPMGDEPRGDPNGYVAVGGIVGKDRFEFNGIAGEIGRRVHGPWFGRVMAQAGNASLSDFAGRGTYTEGRIGAEARTCRSSGMICGSLGLDLGMHRGKFTRTQRANQAKPEEQLEEETRVDTVERFDSTVVVPRLTIDGGGRIRVRGVLELPYHLREADAVTGIAVSLSLGVGF